MDEKPNALGFVLAVGIVLAITLCLLFLLFISGGIPID